MSKSWRRYGFGPGPSVDVLIELPTGSRVHAESSWAAFRCEGRLGECRIKTGSGIRLDETGPLDIDSSHGEVAVERVAGDARVKASSGKVRIGAVDGTAEIKNSLRRLLDRPQRRRCAGQHRVRRHHPRHVDGLGDGTHRLRQPPSWARSHGGSIDLNTSYGAIEVGIRRGTAAWLDVSSKHGRVHNALETTDSPAQTDETVEVRANTAYGDIMIRRA